MKPGRIVIAEDDAVVGEDLRTALQASGYEVAAVVATGADAVIAARRAEPELCVFDINLAGDIDGIEAARRVREEMNLPVVFITAYSDVETVRRARDVGSFGYILKPFSEDDLRIGIGLAVDRARLERRAAKRQRKLAELAYRDELTGLANRRLLELRGSQLIEEGKRRGEHNAFLYLDLIGFKQVNDRLGHAAGDEVLQHVADRLRVSLRGVDIAARMGGDEFGVLLSGARDTQAAIRAAERCFDRVHGTYALRAGRAPIQARGGLAIFPDHGSSLSDLIAAADLALAAATARTGAGLIVAAERLHV